MKRTAQSGANLAGALVLATVLAGDAGATAPVACAKAVAAPAQATRHCSVAPIVLDGTTSGMPTPISTYPVPVPVAAAQGVVSRLVVRVEGLTHTRTEGLRLLLEAPDGRRIALRDGNPSNFGPSPVAAVDLEFDDLATRGSHIDLPVRPGRYIATGGSDAGLPAPAPQGDYLAFLDDFAGAPANGEWKVWIAHEARTAGVAAAGSITRVCLELETAPAAEPCRLGGPQSFTSVLDNNDMVVDSCLVTAPPEAYCGDPRPAILGSVCFSGFTTRVEEAVFATPEPVDTCVMLVPDLSACPAGSRLGFLAITDGPEQVLVGGAMLDGRRRAPGTFRIGAGLPWRLQFQQSTTETACGSYGYTLHRRPCPGIGVHLSDGFEPAPPAHDGARSAAPRSRSH